MTKDYSSLRGICLQT